MTHCRGIIRRGLFSLGLAFSICLLSPAGTLVPDQTIPAVLSGEQFGINLACGDLNGDGRGDLAVVSGIWPRIANVYPGRDGGLETNAVWTAEMGFGDLCFCDVNGDGCDDLLAQYQSPTLSYGIRLWMGSATGLATSVDWSWYQNAYVGYALDAAGDVNGDGYPDVIVGEYGYSAGGLVNEGAVYLFAGGAAGLSNAPALRMTGGTAHAWMGVSVSGLGDVNGDGFDDFAVGYADGFRRAEVCFGAADFSDVSIGRWEVTAVQAFGSVVAAAGDVNNDGFADWLGCSKEYESTGRSDTGIACLFLGGSNAAGRVETIADAAWSYEGLVNSDWFGCAAAGIGDVNRDGYDDVVIGAERNGLGAYQGGTVYLIYGEAGGLASGIGEVYSASLQYANLGHAICGGVDFDGDGGADWAASAPYYDSSDGVCYLFHGEPPAEIPIPALIRSAPAAGGIRVSWLNPSNMSCRVYRSGSLTNSFVPYTGAVHSASSTNYVIDSEGLPQAFYQVMGVEAP